MLRNAVIQERVWADKPSVRSVGKMGSLTLSPWFDHGSIPAGASQDPLNGHGVGAACYIRRMQFNWISYVISNEILFIADTGSCPTSHPAAINKGLYCCDTYVVNNNVVVGYDDPKEICPEANRLRCPDLPEQRCQEQTLRKSCTFYLCTQV